MPKHQNLVALGLLVVAFAAEVAAQQPPAELVTIETGNLPIILSAPHGGRAAVPGVTERRGIGVDRFTNKSDFNTDLLTQRLADAIERKLGKRPYVVIARFHRKLIDANRPPHQAYETDQAAAVYKSYHQALVRAQTHVMERWGRGILLDIHGQKADPSAVFRGTQNGQTTTHLVQRFGREALTGPSSLFGRMAEHGLAVFPEPRSAAAEHARYDGGYTVVTYGSGSGGTVDAIQLELGRSLRDTSAIPTTAEKVTEAIVAFAKDYLPQQERQIGNHGTTTQITRKERRLFSDDFADGKREGWFALDRTSSTLAVDTNSGQLPSAPELTLTPREKTLQSVSAHFPEASLNHVGESLTLQFDARHNTSGFVDRGFRFGLFRSGTTRFSADGESGTQPTSLDDSGYYAIVDLGSSTTRDSAILRETDNKTDARLWRGSRVAAHDNDEGRDPLMFTRKRNYTWRLTVTRKSDNRVELRLRNSASGDAGALTGVTKPVADLTLDTIYVGTYGTTGTFSLDNMTVTYSRGVSRQRPETNRVGVYVDDGAGPSVKDLLFVLEKNGDNIVRRITARDIQSGVLDELDVLIHPGGSGGGQGRHLEAEGRDAIRGFVQDGGGYIGICAGAYLASADYSWSLNILDAKVLDRKHWARGTGMVDLAVNEDGRQLLQTSDERLPIFYGQGPLLAPGHHPEIDDYEVLATFETEIAKNGAPRGVMKGTTAIARGKYGRGRVVCFSPHPELTRGLHPLVQHAVDYVRNRR